MTKIKFCGIQRACDIETVNALSPDYIGFVFVPNRKRYIAPKAAQRLREKLSQGITPVGVFLDEKPSEIAAILEQGIVDIAQLHGSEDEDYIRTLRTLTGRPIIKAFRIASDADIQAAQHCSADFILLDSGTGTGKTFDWSLIRNIGRPFFLAGGLNPDNVRQAIADYKPYAVDVSSGIETDGAKDKEKMNAFLRAVHSAQDKEENI